MRTFDELEAAALATGTYAEYVGDGYSVPWQVAIPAALPVAVTMYAYKAYLDLAFFPGSKLHDWCYTPYGALINVTRLEADEALREFIARTSVPDSLIVYAAVRAGGSLYFGTSQTGYSGIQAYRGVPSQTVPPPILPGRSVVPGVPTMALKIALLMQGSTNPNDIVRSSIDYRTSPHAYGFSEGMWYDGNDDATFRAALLMIAGLRNDLLPAGGSVIAARIYTGGTGSARVQRFALGAGGPDTDQVNVAIYCRTQNPANSVQRGWWIHTVPDDQVLKGEFNPTVAYANKVSHYFRMLCTGGWRYRGINRTQLRPVISITAGGLMTIDDVAPYVVGNFVSVKRTSDVNKRRRGGRFMVQSVGPLGNQCTLAAWPYGACTGGSAFIGVPALFPFGTSPAQTPFVERVGTKKVGRPFEQYVGRKSARRP